MLVENGEIVAKRVAAKANVLGPEEIVEKFRLKKNERTEALLSVEKSKTHKEKTTCTILGNLWMLMPALHPM